MTRHLLVPDTGDVPLDDTAEALDADTDHAAGVDLDGAPVDGPSDMVGAFRSGAGAGAVARIAGFVSRSEAGLRSPRSRSTRINPADGGVAVHYGGGGRPPSSHAGCLATWRGWQSYHMDTHGWQDLAYSFGFCNHGYVLAGRGFGTRTAANGTNAANSAYYAAVWIGGGSYTPSADALNALAWIIAESRADGGAGDDCYPHRKFKSTTCCGDYLSAVTGDFHRKAIAKGGPAKPVVPTPGMAEYPVQAGDTLISIAERAYGDPDCWQGIADANPKTLNGTTHIAPGMTLWLPKEDDMPLTDGDIEKVAQRGAEVLLATKAGKDGTRVEYLLAGGNQAAHDAKNGVAALAQALGQQTADPAAFAAEVAELLVPLIGPKIVEVLGEKAGLTAEDVRDAIRDVLGSLDAA